MALDTDEQNSVRHCLSYNPVFVNIDRESTFAAGETGAGKATGDGTGGSKGRGGYWTIADKVRFDY
jgi:hypothetical protein